MPFDVMYPDKTKEMKRTVLEYLKTLHRQHTSGADARNTNADIDNEATLEIHQSGFPVAPRLNSWRKITRGKLEPLYRMYITQHYRKWN
jgi:hypothetical protein